MARRRRKRPALSLEDALDRFAALTERVRITFSVLVLPMHNTVQIAKQVATLDVLSGGRVTLGLGVGGREEDYVAVGAEYDKRIWQRLEDQVGPFEQRPPAFFTALEAPHILEPPVVSADYHGRGS